MFRALLYEREAGFGADAMRPPPRAPPHTDYEELCDDLAKQFIVRGPNGLPQRPPPQAAAEWAEHEIQMWFASGGTIEPPDNPQMRKQAAAAAALATSPAQQAVQDHLKAVARAARKAVAVRKAPYLDLLKRRDLDKALMYRDAALARGHPPRPGVSNLFPDNDLLLRELRRTRNAFPFVKHILAWDDEVPELSKALYGEEGFAHGASAALRGFDARLYWDASSLKVVGAVRYSQAAAIAWQPSGGELPSFLADGTKTWMLEQVHGGCVEAVLDDLTAEATKINVAPEVVTAEISFKLLKPSQPGVTYKLEAEIGECTPPRCTTIGRILTLEGQLVAEATAVMAMIDRKGRNISAATASATSSRPASVTVSSTLPECPDSVADRRSLCRVFARGEAGGGIGAARGDAAATLAEIRRLQHVLVKQLQHEHLFSDDLEPPEEAFGWSEAEFHSFFDDGHSGQA